MQVLLLDRKTSTGCACFWCDTPSLLCKIADSLNPFHFCSFFSPSTTSVATPVTTVPVATTPVVPTTTLATEKVFIPLAVDEPSIPRCAAGGGAHQHFSYIFLPSLLAFFGSKFISVTC